MFVCAIAATFCLVMQSGAIAKGNPNANSNKSHGNKGNSAQTEPQDSMAASTDNVNYGNTPANKGSTPPGWDKGNKTGWQGGSVPPGWQNWDDKTRATWQAQRIAATNEIMTKALDYKFPTTAKSQMLDAFSQAILGGTMINDAKNKIISAMKDEDQRKLLMLNTMQTTLQIIGGMH